jgi:predicted transcriptional regulator
MSKLDVAWRHVNRAMLSLQRIHDDDRSGSQTIDETLEELEELGDRLLEKIEDARKLL